MNKQVCSVYLLLCETDKGQSHFMAMHHCFGTKSYLRSLGEGEWRKIGFQGCNLAQLLSITFQKYQTPRQNLSNLESCKFGWYKPSELPSRSPHEKDKDICCVGSLSGSLFFNARSYWKYSRLISYPVNQPSKATQIITPHYSNNSIIHTND